MAVFRVGGPKCPGTQGICPLTFGLGRLPLAPGQLTIDTGHAHSIKGREPFGPLAAILAYVERQRAHNLGQLTL